MPCRILETFPFTHSHAVEILAHEPWTQDEISAMLRGGLASLHHNFGQHIRNIWQLWEPSSPLSRHYQKVHGLGHADDMSSLIILNLLARLRDEEFDMAYHVDRYRKFWLERNVDPVSQREMH